MAYIKSRKHALAPRSGLTPSAAAALMALALPMAASAQSSEAPKPAAPQTETLPEVKVKAKTAIAPEDTYKADTVSSPKFTQPLVNTPQTITVIKKELLRDQAVSTLGEALGNTPGITFTLGENGNTSTGDSIFMRGFDTSGSIFLDGIRDLGTVTRDTFNTEQIEVVKGPSGSDNGRGAPTGYINLSSKAPSLDNFSNATTQVGSGNRVRLTADLNRSFDVGLPGTALRLNVMSDQGDKVGRNVADFKRWGIAPSLAFGLGTPTRAYLSVLHINQDNTPDGGIPAIGYPGYTNAALGIDSGSKVDRSNFYGSTSDFDHVTADMFTARFEHDLTPTTTLRNTSRYGRLTQRYVLTGVNAITIPSLADRTGWTTARSRQGKDQENEIITNQTNLTTKFSTGSVKHALSSGIEFIHERQNNLGFTTSGTTTAANLYNPSTTDSFAAVVPSGAFSKGGTTTVAAYAFDTLEFTPQWQLSTGLRFEKYKTETSGATVVTTNNASTYPGYTVGQLAPDNRGDSDTLVTGKLGVVFKPVTNASFYAAIATSAKPPGSDNFTLNAPPSGTATTSNINSPNLDPQKATSIELGTKWELLDNTLVLTAAVYDTVNKNDQASRDPATGEVTQYGKKKVNGLELGASGMITPAWQVSLGLATMETEVSSGTASQTGSAINFSPKLTFTSWTSYKLPMGLTLGGGARYVDSQTTQVNNGTTAVTGLPEIPSYWAFDAMLGYEVNKNINLQLNVANLADKDYITSVNNGRSRYTLGAPRNVQLTANFQF